MIQEKTQKRVLKVIEALKAGRNLTQALKSAKMLRGHFYSARDAMDRDGNQVVRAHVQSNNSEPKKSKKSVEQKVVKLAPKPNDLLHSQALRENDRLKWAQQLIEEIKGTQTRQTEILKRLMA